MTTTPSTSSPCRVAAHHFHDVRSAVAEMARVLAPGGRLLIIDSYTPADPPETDAILDRIERLRDASHVRDYLLEEWEAMLAEVGLTAQFLDFWNMRMEFDDWTARMHNPARLRRRPQAHHGRRPRRRPRPPRHPRRRLRPEYPARPAKGGAGVRGVEGVH